MQIQDQINRAVKLSLLSFTLMVMLFQVNAQAETMTDSEKKEMLEKASAMLKTAESRSKARFATAIKVYRAAIVSDAAAHELYLKCLEKVEYEDKQKSSSSFRDWKRKHRESSDTPGFRRALRHQLNWLLISIEAAHEPEKIAQLGVKALAKVDAMIDDAELLKPNKNLLSKAVLSTVYAKAYNLDTLGAEGWPSSLANISAIYEEVVMPPLRVPSKTSLLRSAWNKRIKHEGQIKELWSKNSQAKEKKIGLKKDLAPPEYLAWRENTYPELLWRREVDCFESGDEKHAAANMISHISEYIKHKKSLKWTKEFNDLMTPTVDGVSEEGKESEELNKVE